MTKRVHLELRTRLWQQKLTITSAACKAGIRRERLSAILNGRIGPRARDRRLISRALGVSVAEVFPGVRRRQ
jgi:transcriptional regulator with XRE-family HTH domain